VHLKGEKQKLLTFEIPERNDSQGALVEPKTASQTTNLSMNRGVRSDESGSNVRQISLRANAIDGGDWGRPRAASGLQQAAKRQ
jgi:hypothetical protein